MQTQIQADIITAMKAKDELRLNTLRSVKTALDRFTKDNPTKELNDAAAQAVLNTLCKQRKEASEAFRAGNRIEMAEKEDAELLILQSYMPQQATEEDLQAAIAHALRFTMKWDNKALGIIIKNAKTAPELQNKTVDNKRLSDLAKAKLNEVLVYIDTTA